MFQNPYTNIYEMGRCKLVMVSLFALNIDDVRLNQARAK